jgi:hypothetical protein
VSAPELQDWEVDELRDRIGRMLADGLETQTEPFPKLDEERHQLMAELRDLPPGDFTAKLVVGGFTDRHFGPASMNCAECVYYLTRRKWCDLPELALPVEPHWWCRLWRL